MAAESRCVWLYAVTEEAAAPAADELIGVGAGLVRPIRAAGLVAVAGDVGQREFGEAALHRNLEDLSWLEQTARAHHAVIEAVAKRCPVVPLRLATVYHSDAGVQAMLRERAADFRAALARLAGCGEWGVKAFAAAADEQPTAPTDERDGAAAGPGAAYLRRRRAQLTAHQDTRRAATASAQNVYEELCQLAVSARLYRPQPPDLTRQSAPMVLNAAYLVADAQAAAFTAAVRDLSGKHRSVELTLTGPWPAYSFAAASDGESDR